MLRVDAIDVALSKSRLPPSQKQSALPDNMTDLVRLAAEHKDTLTLYANRKNMKSEQLVEAARFYLQTLILENKTDDHKTLGLTPAATAAEIKDHKRMLLKWLHPDLNKNRWESSLFNRVQLAAERLEAPPEARIVPVPWSVRSP